MQEIAPAGIGVTSITAQRSGPGAAACTVTACQLGTVAIGERITLTVRGTVDPAADGVLTNTATVLSVTPDPAPANNTDTHPVEVDGQARLTIEKRDLTDPIGYGETLIYEIRVHNFGPSTAQNVVVTDTLDSRTIYLGNTDSCVPAAGALGCTLGSLAPGQTTYFIVSVLAPSNVVSGTVLVNTVALTTTTTGCPAPSSPTPSRRRSSDREAAPATWKSPRAPCRRRQSSPARASPIHLSPATTAPPSPPTFRWWMRCRRGQASSRSRRAPAPARTL